MKDENAINRIVLPELIHYFRSQEVTPSDAEEKEVWEGILDGVGRKERRRMLRIIVPVMSVAAALLVGVLIIGNGFLTERVGFRGVVAQMMSDSISGNDIQLMFSSDEVVPVDKGATVTFSSNTVNINDEQVLENVASGSAEKYNKVVVPKGKYTRLVLADGSSMHVNAGTTVVFPKTFKKNRREIYVDGEVYLDVTHDAKAPFVVKTALFDVEVLGTAFNVSAYSRSIGSNEVVLVRGEVSVRSRSGQELVLAPDHKAKIYSDGDIRESVVNAEDYVLWSQGILNLRVTPVSDIVIRLSRYYGVNIGCDSDIAQVPIAGKIDLDCGVEEALKRIADAGRFDVVRLGNSYRLKSR